MIESYVVFTKDCQKGYDLRISAGVSLRGYDAKQMYEMLVPYVVKYSGNFAMEIPNSGRPEDRLAEALRSCVSEGGRLRLANNKANEAKMENLLKGVTNYGEACETILSWITEFTVRNSNNSSERLFIAE